MANRLKSPHLKTLVQHNDALRHQHVISAACVELGCLTGEEIDFITRLCTAITKMQKAFSELEIDPELPVGSVLSQAPYKWLFDEVDVRRANVQQILRAATAARQRVPAAVRQKNIDRLRHLTGI